jgi:transaldolase
MPTLDDLRIRIFADGADYDSLMALSRKPYIKGFTTNPTLMRKANISDYEEFARRVLESITDRPVSFEVFADDFNEMRAQALEIASWGPNVNVKIPVTNTRREFTGELISSLCKEGVVVNVTAVFTTEQVRRIASVLDPKVPAIVSVFAGRVADTGVDPVPLMREARSILATLPRTDLLWASPREVLNLFQADEAGCHIVTVTSDLLAKLGNIGKSLEDFSLETVQMFHKDASAANYTIRTTAVCHDDVQQATR